MNLISPRFLEILTRFQCCEFPFFYSRPSGFKTRVHSKFQTKDVHRNPDSYKHDPYFFQRQRFWSEMKEELKKQAEYEKNAPGRRYKKHEIVIFLLLLVFLLDSIRYLRKPKRPES